MNQLLGMSQMEEIGTFMSDCKDVIILLNKVLSTSCNLGLRPQCFVVRGEKVKR